MKLYSLHSFEDVYIDGYDNGSVLTEVPKGKKLLIRGADYTLNTARDFEVSDGTKMIIPIMYYNGNEQPIHIEKGQVIAEGVKI